MALHLDKIVSIQSEKMDEEIDLGDFPILPLNGTIAIEFAEKGLRKIEFSVDDRIAFTIFD